MAEEQCKMPLCYNGDLFTPKAYETFTAQFPETNTFMYGRGLIADPFLVGRIRDQKTPDKQTLRQFHDELYAEYRELLSGDRNVLFRMKELWSYMIGQFTNYEKYAKKIKKSQKCTEYETVVASLFREQELNV
jgi:tRNA-dihydrouridine synthase